MSWLWIAIAAQLIIGSALVFDKLLLKPRSIEPWGYTFWFGLLGLMAFLLLPFGFRPASPGIVLVALLGGVAFIAANFFGFSALEEAEASEALPLIGAIAPIFTLAASAYALHTRLGELDLIGFALLVAGGFVLAFSERRFLRPKTIAAIILSAFFLAGYSVASKLVFNVTTFVTGFFWLKIGGVISVLAMLAIPRIRRIIASSTFATTLPRRTLYFANRGYAALGSLLVSGAIFLAQPALVDATQNLRYLVIFALAWLLLRERFRGRILAGKISAVVLMTLGIALLAGAEYARSLPPIDAGRPIHWGLTFSTKFSRDLGLDPPQTLGAITQELRPQNIRLIAYWDDIEPQPGSFDFRDLDWQFDVLRESHPAVILALGMKTPRWPECHVPAWASTLRLEAREEALRTYLAALVEHYRREPLIRRWQVENEPYLAFGTCIQRGAEFLEQEIKTVKSADPARQVITTDGGEFGLWAKSARVGDVFGTTMYRKVYPRLLGPIFGRIEYPIQPSYFRLKEQLVKWWNREPEKQFIVIELQAEPWEPHGLHSYPAAKLAVDFSPDYFRDTINYANAAGFDEYYLWGAEWWYWMKTTHADPRYWEIAQQVLATPP